MYPYSLNIFLGGGRAGQDPFQGVNMDDIFKEFFGGGRAGGFSSPFGFEEARATQVSVYEI